jgi:hypothetical protein
VLALERWWRGEVGLPGCEQLEELLGGLLPIREGVVDQDAGFAS